MKKHKIFIVGENVLSSGQVGERLSKEHFSVTGAATSVQELIPLLLKNPPDAIILDFSSVSGRQGMVLAELTKKCIDVPLVILTTEGEAPSLAQMKKLNVAACIYKPCCARQLEVALELAINQHQRSQAGEEYRELEKIGYSLSHTFRGPVASILGLTNICRLDVKNKKAVWINGMVEKKARQLDELLGNYFHYLKLRRYKSGELKMLCWEKFFLERLAEGKFADRNQQHLPGIQLNVKSLYLTDPFLLILIFDHILKNALDYRKEQPASVFIAVDEKDDMFEVKVRDSGIGMSESIQKNCFELFYRGTELSVGNGIGLNLVRTAVEKLGGSITIESAENEGSCFTLLLPILKVLEKDAARHAYSPEIL